ncbi:MAG: two-component regulator propeller domain-containing protein [Flavobacteriales bacterium]
MRTILCGFFFITGSITLCAQHHAFFDHIWQREGLSQSQVLCLTQDGDGFIWIGTQDGLNRYDGSQMKTFYFEPFNNESLSDDYILHLQCDGDSLLWINSEEKLDVMNYRTQKVTHVTFPESPKTTIVRTWCVGKETYAWTGSNIARISRAGSKGSLFMYEIPFDSIRKREFFVFSICNDPHENLLAATSYGIFILPKGQRKFIPYSSHYVLSSLFSRPVRSLFVKDERLFFSSRSSYYIFNTQTGKTDSISTGALPTGFITSSGMDRYGQVWIGTNGNGLFCLTPKTNAWTINHYKDNQTQFGLTCNYITTVYCSNLKNLNQVWIGSRDAGLYSFNPYKNAFKLYSAFTEKPHGNFFGVVKDRKGNIWAGSQEGIYRIDPLKGHSYFFNLDETPKSERPFESMYCDKNDNIWVGHGDVLYRIDKTQNKFVTEWAYVSSLPSNQILRISALDSTHLLLGTRNGYAVYDKRLKKGEFITHMDIDGKSTKIGAVGAFAKDGKGNLWLGTSNGLFFLDVTGKKNQFFSYESGNRKSLLTPWVLDVRVHPDGKIYTATSKGISAMNPSTSFGEFIQFNHHEGLKSRFIYGMLIDKSGKLWMPTNAGISVFDPSNGSFRTYHSYQGVQLTEFNSGGFSETHDGELLFAGIGGVIGIYPEAIKEKAPEAQVHLQSVRMNGNPIPVSGNTTWAYYENNLEFRFSVLDFYSASDVVLKYRLNAKHNEWISISNSRTLSLANLAAGKYTLEVIGVNADGVISNNPFSFSFVISPPFWNTSWFYGLLIFLFLAVVYLAYRTRLKRKLNLYREIQKAREQESEKSRKAAALDLHDEFGNGLTRISMLTEMVKSKTTPAQPEQLKLLNVISEHSQRLYQGTKDFIWSINPGNDNVYEVVIRIKDHADELLYDSGLKFDVEGLNESLKLHRFDPSAGRNLAMIFQEALYNTVKHAGAKSVKLKVEENPTGLTISLRDDGKGFELKNHTNNFGLGNMKQRAGRIGATLEVRSELTKGCEISVTLPLRLYEKNSSN